MATFLLVSAPKYFFLKLGLIDTEHLSEFNDENNVQIDKLLKSEGKDKKEIKKSK